jgi:hypothetical protein
MRPDEMRTELCELDLDEEERQLEEDYEDLVDAVWYSERSAQRTSET